VRSFVVEGYLGRHETATLEALVGQAAAVAERSAWIRHLGSLVLPDDEICLHVFEAPSLAMLAGASSAAELAHERIVETVWIPPRRGLERT
jgi:hypothetical protein